MNRPRVIDYAIEAAVSSGDSQEFIDSLRGATAICMDNVAKWRGQGRSLRVLAP